MKVTSKRMQRLEHFAIMCMLILGVVMAWTVFFNGAAPQFLIQMVRLFKDVF